MQVSEPPVTTAWIEVFAETESTDFSSNDEDSDDSASTSNSSDDSGSSNDKFDELLLEPGVTAFKRL